MKRFHVWEQFHTLDNIPVFSETCAPEPATSACCAQTPAARPVSIPLAAAPCCGPASSAQPSGCC
jgi:hypothetical protein